MCSVVGSATKEKVAEMLEIMKHRSPDGMKVVGDKKYHIGMGRLAIIDLKSPNLFPYEEDGFTLTFNGEIYNYIELRSQLINRGWKFKTSSDTEVLMKAWREWGVKMFDKLNGMFAFAIYDGKQIILARDIVGEKPLYYRKTPFAFASEAKALHHNCKEFPPAHYAIYDFKEIKFFKYWEFYPREIDLRFVEEELDELLSDAIKLRVRSDVPYGLYFSGGIDSTLIGTYHDFEYLFTYFDGDYKEDFKEKFPKILYYLDYPVRSFSPYGLWRLAEEASKKVKVVLSGEGADELFGGYVRYLRPQFNYEASKIFPSYKGLFQPAKNVNESGWDEFNGNLRELLRMGDRMTSAFGLENRCPFLDRRIIEFAFSLPHNLKIKGFDTKILLKRLLLKRFPFYKDNEKHGLFCSVNEWIGEKDKFDKKKYLNLQKSLWQKQSV